jgi:hypothetical protein
MRSVVGILVVGLIAAPPSMAADDASANFLTRLYMTVCIPNVGQPENVRAWAADKHLQPVTNEVALNVFVGPGDNGGAWAVPAAFGSFALSLRGKSQACAVWARTASPSEVEEHFKTILENAARPGVDVALVKDSRDATPVGSVHTLVYSVTGTDKRVGGFLYSMQVMDRPGGAFQASMQAARFDSP